MAAHTSVSPQEAADRPAIRELVDACAHGADRRDAKGRMSLFTEDCLAHHVSVRDDGQRTLMIASIRCLDGFVEQGGEWLFAERRLMVDRTETRPSTP
jgi:hypothetical protein